MQLVIRVDLEKAQQPLPEIFRLIGSHARTEETTEAPEIDAAGRIVDNRARVIGEWEIEENSDSEDRPHPLEPAYRAAATARYALPGQIEVDRFATVSAADEGAFVQGWLFVPQAEVLAWEDALPPAKPPLSVLPMRITATKAS